MRNKKEVLNHFDIFQNLKIKVLCRKSWGKFSKRKCDWVVGGRNHFSGKRDICDVIVEKGFGHVLNGKHFEIICKDILHVLKRAEHNLSLPTTWDALLLYINPEP